MSAQETPSTCSTCGSELPQRARFCPECGARVEGRTAFEPVPADETGPVPVERFGAGSPAALLVLTAAAVVTAIVLLVLGHWIVGAILLIVGAVLLALYAAGPSRRTRDTPGWVVVARARGRARVESVSAQARARRELLGLRYEQQRLVSERGDRLRALGEAVYSGDEQGTTSARAAVRALDDSIAAKEEEMSQVAERTQARLARARLEASSTQLLEPSPQPAPPEPFPPPVPEPYPPPDEGTPPTPEPVPEPYPPPDEGDPPRQP